MKIKFLSSEELRGKKNSDIDKYIIEMKNTLAELRREISRNQDNKTHQVSLVKKTIARACTIQTAQAIQSSSKGKES